MMHFVREALHRLRSFFRKEPLDRELDVEMDSHIEMAIEENVRQGLPLEEARRHALIQFGGVQQARERHLLHQRLAELERHVRILLAPDDEDGTLRATDALHFVALIEIRVDREIRQPRSAEPAVLHLHAIPLRPVRKVLRV